MGWVADVPSTPWPAPPPQRGAWDRPPPGEDLAWRGCHRNIAQRIALAMSSSWTTDQGRACDSWRDVRTPQGRPGWCRCRHGRAGAWWTSSRFSFRKGNRRGSSRNGKRGFTPNGFSWDASQKRESLSPDQLPPSSCSFPSSLRAISTGSKFRERQISGGLTSPNNKIAALRKNHTTR